MASVQIAKIKTRAELIPSSLNEKDRSVRVCAIAGNWVNGGIDWSREEERWKPVKYRLKVTQDAVSSERISEGLPLLNNHQNRSGTEVFGKTSGWDLENGKFYTTVFYDSDDESEKLWQKLKTGTVTGYSCGVDPEEISITEDKEFIYKDYTKYHPFEISQCAVQADHENIAQNSDNFSTVQIINGVNEMGQKEATDSGKEKKIVQGISVEEHEKALEKIKDEAKKETEEKLKQAMAMESERRNQISRKCAIMGISQSFETKLIESNISVSEAINQMFDHKSKSEKKEQSGMYSSGSVEVTVDAHDTIRQAGIEAIMHRKWGHTTQGKKYQITEKSRRFAGQNLTGMCRIIAQENNRPYMIPDHELVKQELDLNGATKSSDLTAIISGVASESLMDGYNAPEDVFENIVKVATAPNFKDIERKELSGELNLVKKGEFEETQIAKLKDRKEKYKIEEFAKAVPISYRMILGDDLDALADIPNQFGRMTKNLEMQTLAELLLQNPVMSDGKKFFSTDHNNFATKQGSISLDLIEDAWTAITLAEDSQGNPVNVYPRYLLTPATLRKSARKILNPLGIYTENNPLANSGSGSPDLDHLYSPFLDKKTKTGFWLFPDKNEKVCIEKAYLEENNGAVNIRTYEDISKNCLVIHVSHYFGIGLIDWRGAFYNDGTKGS